MAQPWSPRAELHPVTPLRGDGGEFSPFALFSEERKGSLLRVASPTLNLSFEELSRILAEEWESLPEGDKTPYREWADERRLQHEAVGAAIALTQIGTPSFRPGGPSTPVPRRKKVRRCLDIGAPDCQSPRPPPEISHSGYNGASSSNDGGADDADRAGPLDRSVCASSVPPSLPLSSIPSAEASASAPAPPPAAAPAASPGGRSFSSALPTAARGGGVDHLRDVVAGRFMSPAVAAAAASMAVALGNGRGRGDSGNGGYGDGGDGDGEPLSQVGFEIRAAAGTTATAAPEIGGSSSVSATATTATITRARGGSNKGTTTRSTSSGRRGRKPSSFAATSESSARTQSSSPAKTTPTPAGTAAVTPAAKKTRSEERTRRAECKAGRQLVSQMSKKDPARPKGPKSSYILFYTEKMASVKTARPDMSTTDIGTVVGEAWRGLSDEKREVYTKRAEVDRKRYEGQLRAIARKEAADTAAAAAAATAAR